ncbi:hypothetical protein [Saccharibacter floricola]|uniref:Uncharacterized protein n=1 Tax=Saccharibacter floricola DSM 15669 TaxID=1123227 RepID=A0ABQ0P197_9PROT|nr:hypothetical protein [Saccharibacter floricola]GBQ08869.1 hypothetical protein AA15669_1942 [Saccharibacter floricola DSM 15669]
MVRPKAPGDGPKRTRRTTAPKDDDALRRKVRQHGATLIDALIEIATSASSESTRLSAIKELLDRGYGKSFSSVERASSTATPPPSPTLLIQPPSSSASDHDTPQKLPNSTDPH